jgi:hypothetical protein
VRKMCSYLVGARGHGARHVYLDTPSQSRLCSKSHVPFLITPALLAGGRVGFLS